MISSEFSNYNYQLYLALNGMNNMYTYSNNNYLNQVSYIPLPVQNFYVTNNNNNNQFNHILTNKSTNFGCIYGHPGDPANS